MFLLNERKKTAIESRQDKKINEEKAKLKCVNSKWTSKTVNNCRKSKIIFVFSLYHSMQLFDVLFLTHSLSLVWTWFSFCFQLFLCSFILTFLLWNIIRSRVDRSIVFNRGSFMCDLIFCKQNGWNVVNNQCLRFHVLKSSGEMKLWKAFHHVGTDKLIRNDRIEEFSIQKRIKRSMKEKWEWMQNRNIFINRRFTFLLKMFSLILCMTIFTFSTR